MDEKSKVYIKVDARNRITAIDGGYTIGNIHDIENWTLIDEGDGDRYNLCQTHYLPMPIFDDTGVPRYKFVDGEIVERTEEDRAADVEPEEIKASVDERLTELEAVLDILLNGEVGDGDA